MKWMKKCSSLNKFITLKQTIINRWNERKRAKCKEKTHWNECKSVHFSNNALF